MLFKGMRGSFPSHTLNNKATVPAKTKKHRTGYGTPLGRYHDIIISDLFHDPLDSGSRRAWWKWLVSRWSLRWEPTTLAPAVKGLSRHKSLV